jgi:hypothetical protein
MERFKHKVKITAGIKDAYKDFRIKYKAIHPHIRRTKYNNVCYLLNEAISDKIIKESYEFKIPYRLGRISIRKSKNTPRIKDGKLDASRMVPDWVRTWQLWYEEYPGMTREQIWDIKDKIVVYNLNEHTNGYVMKWHWDKSTSSLKNSSVYQFKPTKANRLNLARWINSDEFENDYPITKTYEEQNKRRFLNDLKKQREADMEQERNP